jgi:hypothetical protein
MINVADHQGTDWWQLLGQFVATVVGGLLVMAANHLSNRERRSHERFEALQRERALYTGMFAIRNFISERLNEYNEGQDIEALMPLESALSYINKLVDKTPIDGEALMITVIDVALKLDVVVTGVRRARDLLIDRSQLHRGINDLIGALDHYDTVAGASLAYVSEEELEQMVRRSAHGDVDVRS